MLGRFLKTLISDYDESEYRISPGHYDAVFGANAVFEERDRLDLRIPSLAVDKVMATLGAAGVTIPDQGVVVDLCCGTGYLARGFLGARLTSSVIGIDLARGQLSILKQEVGRADALADLSLIQANTMNLPLANRSVDLVVGNSFLHHLPDVGAALREISRVIKPGGRFLVLHEPSETSTFFESFPLSLFKDIVVENYTDLWQFNAGDLKRLLRAAGFSEIRILRTGILSNVLLGAVSIIGNKYLKGFDGLHRTLEQLRTRLNSVEYRFSWPNAPSLLIAARVPGISAVNGRGGDSTSIRAY